MSLPVIYIGLMFTYLWSIIVEKEGWGKMTMIWCLGNIAVAILGYAIEIEKLLLK